LFASSPPSDIELVILTIKEAVNVLCLSGNSENQSLRQWLPILEAVFQW
jgi:hypothetical protein